MSFSVSTYSPSPPPDRSPTSGACAGDDCLDGFLELIEATPPAGDRDRTHVILEISRDRNLGDQVVIGGDDQLIFMLGSKKSGPCLYLSKYRTNSALGL